MNARLIKRNTKNGKTGRRSIRLYDPWLLFAVVSLILLGLIMVASASIVVSERLFQEPFHFILRQITYLALGMMIAVVLVQIELETWQRYTWIFLGVSYVLLVLVLIPGLGRQINGSSRWLGAGPIALQVSELAKLFMILYLADYVLRYGEELRTQVSGFLKPMFLLAVMAVLLLKEPDFGAAAVIMVTALCMMFLAGVRLWQFAILLAIVLMAMGILAVSSPYRMARLTSFLNPWANQFDSGYQLTQSLIAFGRGGWFGVGLGESVQKLFYLPEAHTDFVFAVFAEEMGLLGVFAVMGLYVLFVARALIIARRAQNFDRPFAAYVGYGLSIWIGMQAVINIGVNSGLLPTKGLTLPLMSYGGSSMTIMCFVVALLFRIDFENRRIALREV